MFFLMMVLVALLAGFLVAMPLLGKRFSADVDSVTLNRQVYEDRLAELEGDRQSGQIDSTEYEALQTELARTLLADVSASGTSDSVAGSRRAGITIMMLVAVLGLAFYFAVQFRPVLLSWWMLESRIGDQVDQVMAGKALKGKPQFLLADFARILQKRVQQQPENPELWMALGMSYFQMQIPDLAAQAYERVNKLSPGRPDVQLALARSRLYANDGKLDDDSRLMVEGLLKQNPHNDDAIVLLATSAFNSGHYSEAVAQFRALLADRGASMDPEARSIVESRIAEAEKRAQQKTAKPVEGGAPVVKVVLKIAPAVLKAMPKDSVVYVFAKAVGGPPMPLAVVRHTLAEVPTDITLDDSLAMMPAMRLSAFSNVLVSAHVSRSGQAKPASGDYQAQPVSLKLHPGVQGADLRIDTPVP